MENPRSRYVPLKNEKCGEGCSVQDDHSSNDEQDEPQLGDWKYSAIKCKSKRESGAVRLEIER